MKKTLLLFAALALSARAEERPDADDPIGRMRAERAGDIGIRTPEMQQRILDEAQSEKLRSGLGAGVFRPVAAMAAAVAGSAWVNIGPTTADLEKNGGTYFKVDSGRARKIIVDPADANVVYFATSGGGVWKTRNALAAVSATTGPRWTPITEGLVSLSIGSLAMNPGNHLSLVLGLGDPFDVHTPGYNIVTSDDGGMSWSEATALSGSYPLTPGVYTATTVRDLAFDPGGAIVLAATDAGLFRSTQGGVGTGWTLIDVDALGHGLQDCWSVAYAGPHNWVLGSIDAASIVGRLWQSTDDGVHWTERSSALASEASDVGRFTLTASAQAAGQPWRVYALASNKVAIAGGSGGDQKDVWRSNDGGASWSSLSMHGCGTGACAGEHPVNVTDDQPDLDFTHDQASYNQMLLADPANPDIAFIGGNLSMGRTTDGGATWSVMTDWLPFGLTTNAGGLDTSRATLAQYAHADWHAGTIAHVGGVDYFYGGNDGGLIRASSNVLTALSPGAVTWEDKLNRGIVSHLIYSVASGKERPTTGCTPGGGDIVWGGFQDNGTRLRILSGGSTYVGYNQIAGGDGFGVGLGCTGAGAAMGSLLISTYVDRISVSTDGGATFTPQVDRNQGTGASIGLTPQIAMDLSYNFKMKVVADLSSDFTYLTPVTDSSGHGHVYRSVNNGLPDVSKATTWLGINGNIHTDAATVINSWPKPMRGVAGHPRTPDHYAAVSGGRVYVTTDGGMNWYESLRAAAGTGTAYLSLFSVAFDPNDLTGKTVWAASPGSSLNDGSAIPTGTGHLFKCTGAAGAAGATCAPSGNGIPEAVPINVVKVDPGDSNTIYAGTEIGLYRSTNGGANWSRYGTGLPLVSVTDVAVNADDSAIRVSTFGRGFWEIHPSLTAPGGVAGTGDLDFSGVIDGFDLVREAAIEFTDRTTPNFNPVGDVVFNNVINDSDLAALIAKLGGLP